MSSTFAGLNLILRNFVDDILSTFNSINSFFFYSILYAVGFLYNIPYAFSIVHERITVVWYCPLCQELCDFASFRCFWHTFFGVHCSRIYPHNAHMFDRPEKIIVTLTEYNRNLILFASPTYRL